MKLGVIFGGNLWRRSSRIRFVWLFFAAAMIMSLPTDPAAGALSATEERGKEIYLTGNSPSGRDITALVGQGLVPTPGSGLPCGTCHGPDGLGRPEGGVVPSNITWGYLTKPYGTVSWDGHLRSTYTPDTLGRAIMLGIDSAGNYLNVSMPRYRIEREDFGDLLAYLKRIETYLDPGLSEERIILGTIVPSTGPLQSLGQAMRAVVEAQLDEINAQGGVYGRKLELEVREADGKTAILEEAKKLGKRAFALVSVLTAGVDDEYAELVEAEGIPTIGPYTVFNRDQDSLQRFSFHLYGGLSIQSRVLVEYAARKLGGQKPRSAVLYLAGPQWAAIAEALQVQALANGWQSPLRIQYASDRMNAGELATRLKDDQVQAVFFFGGPRELLSLAGEAEQSAWAPYLFLSGPLASKEIFELPAIFQDKIFLAYPTVPSDHTQAGVVKFSALQRRRGLTQQHLLAQIGAYSATKILVEGLKRTGRALSREKLIGALEKIYEYETGLTPKLTYGPNRRVGSLGAYVVSVDLEKQAFRAASEWVELKQR